MTGTSLPLLDSFPQFGGNRLRAAFFGSAIELFNSLPMTYNFSRGLGNRRAHACRFPGIVLAWGRQTVGVEHSLNPVNLTATLIACRTQSSLLAKTMPRKQKFQTFFLGTIF
jgi:hypothetical protein